MVERKTVQNIFTTMAGKVLILLGSFGTMALSARFWGAEGRGVIALYVANLSLATIFSNIFTNSSACYYSPRVGAAKLWLQVSLWTFGVSALAAPLLQGTASPLLTLVFFVAATLSGMITFYLSVFLGRQQVPYYNVVTVLEPVLTLLLMLLLRYTVCPSYFAYFYAQVLAYALCTLVCHVLLHREGVSLHAEWSWQCFRQNFLFGIQEETGTFLQFLNYRLPYYFLSYYCGLASIGVFSIGVALSESIWVISRSISLVQYSNLLNPDRKDAGKAVSDTLQLSVYSLVLSAVCVVVALLLPSEVYIFVFGPEFVSLKWIILLLSPGILLVSAAKVYGHYFSALGQLRVLVVSSACGAVVSLGLSALCIRQGNITGACLATVGAHLCCSAVLIVWFFRARRRVNGRD
jgi:O-antigen/teichoic acid export membrane protein